MRQEEIKTQYTQTYDKGLLNHGVRAWFYLQRGLSLINEFKYLVAGILAIYYTLKLDSVAVLITIFIISIPVLTFIGWFHTHKMSKALEWTNMAFSSYFARYNVDLAEKNTESTIQIEKEIKEIKEILREQSKRL